MNKFMSFSKISTDFLEENTEKKSETAASPLRSLLGKT